MPIFVSNHHFLNNLLYIFISSFYSVVHLRSVRGRIGMLDPPLGA